LKTTSSIPALTECPGELEGWAALGAALNFAR
jgi:hypothetical protein